MALVIADRVKETTITTGLADFALLGPVTSFQSFNTGVAVGNTTYYCANNDTLNEWEVGIGTLTNSTTLARTTILSSSSGGTTKVYFSAGTKDVFCTQPAEISASAGGATGQLQYNSAGAFAGTPAALYSASGTLLSLTAQQNTDIPIVVSGAGSGQTANLQEWHGISPYVASVDRYGNVTCNYLMLSGGATGGTCQIIPDSGNSYSKFVSSYNVCRFTGQLATDYFKIWGFAPSVVALTCMGVSGQTANLTEWQDSSNNVLAKIYPAGWFENQQVKVWPQGGTGTTVEFLSSTAMTTGMRFTAQSGQVAMAVNPGGGQYTATLNAPGSATQFTLAYGTYLGWLQMHSSGELRLSTNLGPMVVIPASASAKGLVVRGIASQSGNLTEWQDSTSAVLAAVTPSGGFLAQTTNGQLQTTITGATVTLRRDPASGSSACYLSLDGATGSFLNFQFGSTTNYTFTSTNASLFASAGSYAGGSKVLFIGNCASTPTSGNPSGGGILYVDWHDSSLKYLGPTGSPTTIAPNTVPIAYDARLTLASNLAVTTSDITAASTLYLLPYRGNRISVFDGVSWGIYALPSTGLSLNIGSLAVGVYDIYLDGSGGVGNPTLGSVAWSSTTARATALIQQDGVYCVGVNSHVYLGTIYISATGQTNDAMNLRHVWNYHQRVQRPMLWQTTTVSWSYNSITWRQANGGTGNDANAKLSFVTGVAEEPVFVQVKGQTNTATAGLAAMVGIGLDSTTVNSSDTWGETSACIAVSHADYQHSLLGFHTTYWLESSRAGASTFIGVQTGTGVANGQSCIRGTIYA
jgi:hypothetical protein